MSAGRLPRLPAWLWLLLPALALWPVWLWSLRRMSDGSDDPYGVVALAMLLLCLWREREHVGATPRPAWLLASLALSGLAIAAGESVPALARGVLAVLAVLGAALALRRPRQPALAWLGLGLLALPILSSLQFFAGYPLRLITAEASVWLLRGLGLAVERQGSTLDVGGQLVMVDAPCSGIHMAWVAYFCAFASAAWLRLGDVHLMRRLPLLGVLVLAGNSLRNTLLVLQETGQSGWPDWMHEATGLAVFVAVCALVLRVVSAGAQATGPGLPVAVSRALAPGWQWSAVGVFVALGLCSTLTRPLPSETAVPVFVEWPQRFEGSLLRPLALSAVEQRFVAEFPGAIARFSAGPRAVTLRHVTAATRKLHPAADCFRGLGYRIDAIGLRQRPAAAGLQRCFVASGKGPALSVCEYIEDAAGRSFSDHSAWYWAAIAGASPGPWRAVTVAEAL
ncbi:exosortase Q [Pseudomonas sp. PDM14]|uniref:exosortase Q n=1 Tax=Pseudomonas sp. PDM14 TaxID=2769288 RepID=UPI0017825D3B|nr:exosortase Q [Pseudomonas sp. PDM14]MBD9485065.1 exosortase Q [Pseudomonas sp. PDM14]